MHRFFSKLLEVPRIYNLVQETIAHQGHQLIQSKIQDLVTSDSKVLDIGCGTGEYAKLFSSPYYVGIDTNPEYIHHAQEHHPGTFQIASALQLPFDDNSFYVTFAVGLHHHLTNQEASRALQEMLRVTTPGGKMLIFDALLPPFWKNPLGYIFRKIDRGGHVRTYQQNLELTIALKTSTKNTQLEILYGAPLDYISIHAQKI